MVNDYLAGGQTIYMNRDTAERLLNVTGVDAYLLHVDHDFLPEVRSELATLTRTEGLVLESFSQVHEQIDQRMSVLSLGCGAWYLSVFSSLVWVSQIR